MMSYTYFCRIFQQPQSHWDLFLTFFYHDLIKHAPRRRILGWEDRIMAIRPLGYAGCSKTHP
jgi:hypothetical protein